MGGDGMETVEASDVATNISNITSYGSQIAKVFHNHVLIAAKIPVGFEGSINILDATIATLNQLLALLEDETESPKKLFSREGLTYVNILAKECATNLALISLTITKASSIDRKDPKSRRNKWKKTMLTSSDEKAMATIALEPRKLDEKDFLSKVENAKWNRIQTDIENCMERLYELQLHLLLVFQVVTVGGLSKDVSSGKVDIQSIVTFHERINRTADLLGLGPRAPSKSRYGRRNSIRSSDSDSDSDASTSSVGSRPRQIRGPPPPPPPGFKQTPAGPGNCSSGFPPPTPASTVPGNTKPPSYAESHSLEAAGSSDITSDSTLLGTVPSKILPGSQVGTSSESGFPNEKAESRAVLNSSKEEKLDTKEQTKAVVSEARLFKSRSTGFAFKIKSFFRSKASLAEEMKRALNDAESTLSAFIINEDCLSQVPHSVFHSLEWTHMRTILSQLNDNKWYKTFSELTPTEGTTLSRITNQRYATKIYRRDVVVLKVLQQNRWNAWMRLLTSEGLSTSDDVFPHHINGRIILAIVREKLSDKCPPVHSQLAPVALPPPPPPPPPSGSMYRSYPPPGGVQGSQSKGIRPPILPSYVRPNGLSDLALPAPPPPPPSYPSPVPSRTPLPVFPALPGKKTMDMTPITEHDALVAMTTYNEYTFRLAPQSLDDSVPRTWRCVSITQEATDHTTIVQHLVTAEHRGCNVMTSKLRLNQDQDAQVTRLMDELQKGERDNRFEWTWAEISLFDEAGEYIDLGFIRRGPAGDRAAKMHLIAKRMPKRECKAQDLYEQLMRNPGAPPPCASIYVPPYPPHPPVVIPARVKRRGRSSSVSSSSSYDSSDSEASVGVVRRRMRKFQKDKAKREWRSLARGSDSDSDSDSEKEDVIKIQVDIKRSDEVVKKLVELWTPEEGKGKGKEIA